MKYFVYISVFILWASLASAEPIGTRSGCYTAMWASASEADCDRVCREHGLSAESMNLSSASTQKIFVCRHKGRTQYTFGEQGSGNCRVMEGGTPVKKRNYECLCVRNGCSATSDSGVSEPVPELMSKKDCIARLNSAVEQMRVKPNKKTYKKAKSYCSKGDLGGALEYLNDSMKK